MRWSEGWAICIPALIFVQMLREVELLTQSRTQTSIQVPLVWKLPHTK